ncbi:MAG: 16S rRNA (guanine(966)-N(2))-methyltransferase RsmD [Clostridia bacterium]|nr:16S rRNA (guanine(966)-N(2))-methyltransferase RsmD [Clostridia bacterium]
MMRIITGSARGTRLATLEGEATRPTAERVKEAVFSMLQSSVPSARVLDLFAGSGQMGLEALSRGARHAVFCDSAKEALAVTRANAEKTRLSDRADFFCADARTLLRRMKGEEPFDLVFLDPPYAAQAIPSCLSLLLSCALLAPDARIVCETAREEDVFCGQEALAQAFDAVRTARYGAAFITVLTQKEETV